jgi:hypothetical protein
LERPTRWPAQITPQHLRENPSHHYLEALQHRQHHCSALRALQSLCSALSAAPRPLQDRVLQDLCSEVLRNRKIRQQHPLRRRMAALPPQRGRHLAILVQQVYLARSQTAQVCSELPLRHQQPRERQLKQLRLRVFSAPRLPHRLHHKPQVAVSSVARTNQLTPIQRVVLLLQPRLAHSPSVHRNRLPRMLVRRAQPRATCSSLPQPLRKARTVLHQAPPRRLWEAHLARVYSQRNLPLAMRRLLSLVQLRLQG